VDWLILDFGIKFLGTTLLYTIYQNYYFFLKKKAGEWLRQRIYYIDSLKNTGHVFKHLGYVQAGGEKHHANTGPTA
jgi:hypothetical protein